LTGIGDHVDRADGADNLYVSDSGNWRVQKLAPDRAFLDQWRNCRDSDPPCALPDAARSPANSLLRAALPSMARHRIRRRHRQQTRAAADDRRLAAYSAA